MTNTEHDKLGLEDQTLRSPGFEIEPTIFESDY